MKKELQELVLLQEKDHVLNKLKERAEAIPKAINEQTEALNKIKAEVEELKNNTKKLLMARKGKEIELETKENEIKKHNMELNSIKTNDAYKILVKEIEQCKNIKLNLEEEILVNMEATEIEAKKAKEEEAKLKINETAIKAKELELKNDLDKIIKEIDLLEKEKNESAKNIPESLLSIYEHIKESKQGVAIVPIEGDKNCGGCFIPLRPQTINEVYKEQDMVFCDECSRILYKK